MKICPECLERFDEDRERCPDDETRLRTIHARKDDPMEGRVLDEKWVLESRIGGGGMGTVYRAHQLSVDRTVAVKVLRSALCEDDDHVERFFREANVASNIDDPRCVTIYDFGQTEGDQTLYLAMEYLDGESLQQRVTREQLTLEQTLAVGRQIAGALEVLHERGVVHRDLKPENVRIVDEIGRDVFLKLLDFGLAKHTRSDETPVTATGEIFGTPAFMSPEQCMGSEIGPPSDLYAFGCLMYQLVAGRTPFEGGTSVEMLMAHVNRTPPPLDGRPAVPTRLAGLIESLLAKDPRARPPSAEAVAEKLAAIAAEIDGESDRRPALLDERLADESTVSEESSGGDEPVDADHQVPETRTGVVPVDTLGDDEEVALGGRARETEPTDADRRSPGVDLPTPLLVAALVVAAGSAAIWAFADTSRPAGASEVGGLAPVASLVARGAAEIPPARARLDEAVGRGSDAVSSAPTAVAEGVATWLASEPQRGDTTRPAPDPEPRARPPEDEPDGERDPALLPVLTESAATQVFRSKNPEIETCFEKAVGSPEFAGGTIQLRLVVDGSGEVRKATIGSSTVDDRRVHECATDRAAGWSFPPPSGGGTARLIHEYTYEMETLE